MSLAPSPECCNQRAPPQKPWEILSACSVLQNQDPAPEPGFPTCRGRARVFLEGSCQASPACVELTGLNASLWGTVPGPLGTPQSHRGGREEDSLAWLGREAVERGESTSARAAAGGDNPWAGGARAMPAKVRGRSRRVPPRKGGSGWGPKHPACPPSPRPLT